MINIAVCGSNGKMGKAVIDAVNNSSDMVLVAQIDINEGQYKTIFEANQSAKIDVLIDFTQPSSIYENALYCLNNNINIVIGTTGLNDIQIDELKKISIERQTGCIIAPNFSIGAVLLMQFAKIASKYFSNAEIIELHHNQKKDAPSGTAIKTAQMISEEDLSKSFVNENCAEVEALKGARGAKSYNDIHIHSVRMPGFMASQEVLFGSNGQILTLRHDSFNRECYMPGVLMATRYVYEKNEFIYGLENIM